jgi:hypothetical protein
MNDRKAETAAGLQDTRSLSYCCRHRIDVMKRHEGNRQISAFARQRERGCIGPNNSHRWIDRASGGGEGRRSVDPNHRISKVLEMACEAAFTAADIDRQLPGRGQKLEELIAVVSPIAVVTGRSRPVDPLSGVCFPSVSEAHDPSDIDEDGLCPLRTGIRRCFVSQSIFRVR